MGEPSKCVEKRQYKFILVLINIAAVLWNQQRAAKVSQRNLKLAILQKMKILKLIAAGLIQKSSWRNSKKLSKEIIFRICRNLKELQNFLIQKRSWKWGERKVNVPINKPENKIKQIKDSKDSSGWTNIFFRVKPRKKTQRMIRLTNSGDKWMRALSCQSENLMKTKFPKI